MKNITQEMIKEYRINKLGYDFMGYTFNSKQQLSFHHAVISHRDCKRLHIPQEGYYKENGVILRQDTSHDYLHRIENIDPEIFYLITSEMMDENIKGKIDIENLKYIRDMLLYFEREHDHDRTKKGKLLIKREYIERRIKL